MVGPGRFALPPKFTFISEFFNRTDIPTGSYSKLQLARELGLPVGGLAVSQKDFADSTDDYAERVFLWGSTSFTVDDRAVFFVEADGTKYIENFAIRPLYGDNFPSNSFNNSLENFDFDSSNLVTKATTWITQPWFDPSGIGRTVNFAFDDPIPLGSYDREVFARDTQKVSQWQEISTVELYTFGLEKLEKLRDRLWDAGVIDPVRNDGYVVYGTDKDDTVYAPSKLDRGKGYDRQAALLESGGYTIGGPGNDTLIASGERGYLLGGTGSDTFVIGSGAFIIDAEPNEKVYLGPVRLFGGVNQWWNEAGAAYWAPFTAVLSAFPTVGSSLLTVAAGLGDAVAGTLARYRILQDDTLVIEIGLGLGGKAYLQNYSLDLDTGVGSGGITVFQRETGEVTRENLDRYINLARYAGFGVGLNGVDPLVLDLDGDGYQLGTERNSSVWFDYNHNGFAQHTGWARGSDGFLVRDANGNGRIDSIAEMFGNPTQGGFDMLAGFDDNGDGAITSADAIYAALQVWQDKNENGVTDAGELKSLAELGIVSISLASTAPTQPTEVGGNRIARESSFTFTDGRTYKLADVVFDVSVTNTKYLGDTTVSAAAAALPELTGFGHVADLRVAMTQDAALLARVESFVTNATADLTALKSGAEAILYAWADVNGVAATAIGSDGFDARKLAFLEKYSGTQLMPRDADGAPTLANLAEMEELWADQVTRLTLRLVVQGPMASQFAGVEYRPDLDLLVASSSTALADILHQRIAALPAGDLAAAAAEWAAWAPLLGALTESMVRHDNNVVRDDFLFQQLVRAFDGAIQPLTLAELAAGIGIEGLTLGTAGTETLARTTDAQTTVIYGGGGDDALTGGTGQDVYVFGRQIGHAVITDAENNPAGDRIRFAFLNAADVNVERAGHDLLITVKATGETITVKNQFAPVVPYAGDILLSANQGVEDIQFADGTIWEGPEIATAVGTGTDGVDHMVGTMHTDVLIGGKSNDRLEGGDDADLYVVNAGDGQDVISDVQSTPLLRGGDMLIFGDGIAPEDVTISRAGANGQDLLFSIGNSGQSVLVEGQFSYGVLGYNGRFATNSRIEVFTFREYGDGWSSKDVQQQLIAQASTGGDDTVRGFGDDDTFDGGAGDDLLVGLDGADTYAWGHGDGDDRIQEQAQFIPVDVGLGGLTFTGGADTVLFKDANREDLVFARPTAAADLVITDKLTGETLTVIGQFAGFQTGSFGAQWMDRVEFFQFADGTRISWAEVMATVTTGGDGDDGVWGDLSQDTLSGGRGDDYLSGKGYGDVYRFNLGDGHDTLQDGNPSILGGGFVSVDDQPDILQLGPGILPEHVTFARNGSSIDLVIGPSGDRVTLKGQDDYMNTMVFGAISADRIEEVRFDNGVVWTWEEINRRVIAQFTTVGNDVAEGFTLEDRFEKSAGDDLLKGGESGDTYVFGVGAGHDVIQESVSNVAYDDHDTVEFDATVSPADVVLSRSGNDLILTLSSGDRLTVNGQFEWLEWFTWHDIETFRFADGTVWSKEDVQRKLLQSTGGADHLVGFGSDDVLDGGLGNDVLEGRDGADTYRYDRGGGNDVIREVLTIGNLSDFDQLAFGPAILPEDIRVSREGADLVMIVIPTGETIRVEGQFNYLSWFAWNDIELFTFANGTSWTDLDVAAKLTIGTSSADHIYGTFRSDTLDGKAGDDTLEGGDGSDTYLFGRGYGQDRIIETVTDGNLADDDRLVFGPGVLQSDVFFSQSGGDLIVTIAGTDDKLTIQGQFGQVAWFTWHDIERFEFADGTSLTKDEVRQKLLGGTPGDDHIVGFASDDLIEGGPGDDVLEGDEGSDTYRFGVGDGHDLLNETLRDGRASEYDTLEMKPGVAPGDVSVTRNGQDAIFTLASGDSIRVQGQFNEGYNEFLSYNDVERVTFADGTVWDKAEIDRRSIRPTAGDDVLQGTWYKQTYDGLGGNDTIYAGGNDDLLIGGTGNDRLEGQGGNDTYVYRPGDGDDVVLDTHPDGNGFNRLVFGPGIAPADLRFAGNPNDGSEMTVSFSSSPGSIRILGQWYTDAGIDEFEFADGTIWNTARIAEAFVTVAGTPGNDTIYGTANADIIDGLGGDDALFGGLGDDTYRFGRGYGVDTVWDRGPEHWWGIESGGTDKVVLGDGVTPADIDVLQPSGEDMAIQVKGTNDRLLLRGTLSDSLRRIETVEFADGTIWSYNDLLARALLPTDGNDVRYAGDTPATLTGAAGDDTLYGSGGSDVLDGGSGRDSLFGGAGDDLYRFGRGDGSDTILDRGPERWWGFEGGGSDTVALRSGVAPDDVEVVQPSSEDISIRIKGTNDELRLSGTLVDPTKRIENVSFSDGTVWSYADLLSRALTPTDGNDVRWAGDTPSTLLGGGGDDTLYGSTGADVINGGVGNDALVGGQGDDVYRFGRGDGADTILDRGAERWWGWEAGGNDTVEFGAGIVPADLEVLQTSPDDITIRIRGTSDQLTIYGTLSDAGRRMETFRFTDGTSWTYADLFARSLVPTEGDDVRYAGDTSPVTLLGAGGNDTLNGSPGADTLDGGAGNDNLRGGSGDDTYRFGRGDGNDAIYDRGPERWWGWESGGNDTVQLRAGLTPADISVILSGDDLALVINDTQERLLLVGSRGDSSMWIERVQFGDGVVWDRAQLEAQVTAATMGADTIYGTASADHLRGLDGDDRLFGGDGDDQISGDAGDDTLYGEGGHDTILGGSGNDILAGGAGNDLLDGGAGNDVLYGVAGDDVFGFGIGYGQDVIREFDGSSYGGEDLVQLGAGITPSDIAVVQSDAGQDLIIKINGTTDQLTLDNTVVGAGERVERLRFADGTIWTYADMLAAATTPTAANDQFWGGPEGDSLSGGAGDDVLRGQGGNDLLDGGAGNDLLFGVAGDDSFVFGFGYGQDIVREYDGWSYGGNDTVLLQSGITPSDISIVQADDGGDLIIRIIGTADQITLDNTVIGAGERIEQLRFADGTTWSYAQMLALATAPTAGNDQFWGGPEGDSLSGGAGDDVLRGRAGDDTLAGGAGNDILYGVAGDDTYLFGVGDGQDVVREYDGWSYGGTDTVQLGAGITSADVTVVRADSERDLVLILNATGDRLTLDNSIVGGGERVEYVRFADGTVWDHNQLMMLSSPPNALAVTSEPNGLEAAEAATFARTGATSSILTSTSNTGSATTIVLDLNGDGETGVTQGSSKAKFDWDGDGKRDRTAWIGKGDGLLVFDRNGDGKMSGASELSFSNDKPAARSGLAGLSAFDSNGDGLFSALDKEWASFRVWADKDRDGKVDKRELKTLADVGIASIDLLSQATNSAWNSGEVATVNTGTFTRTNGSLGGIGDVMLSYLASSQRPAYAMQSAAYSDVETQSGSSAWAAQLGTMLYATSLANDAALI